MLSVKEISRYTPSIFGWPTSGSSESGILVYRWVLVCVGSGVNKVTADFGADINNELTCKKLDISVR